MVVNLKSQTDMSGFYIIYEGSTNLEKEGWYGISHLMEHLMCKNFEHLHDKFDEDGIDWNAYTSSNEVVFYFTGLDEFLSPVRDEIVQLMSNFNVTEEQFNKERSIVLQEYTDYFSKQTDSHYLNVNRKLFKDFDPIGKKEDLINLSYDDCVEYFDIQFSKPTKIINVSAKSPFKTKIEFNKYEFDREFEFGPYDEVPLEEVNDFGDKSSLLMVSKLIEDDFAYIKFITTMLCNGLSSPLYQEVREKRGLVYYIRCYLSRLNNKGAVYINTQTSTDNVNLVFDAIEEVFDNPEKYLTRERFEIVKKMYLINIKKSIINRYENVYEWIQPKDWSVKEIIKDITYEKVLEVFNKYFKFDKFYLSHDKEEFK